MSFKNKLKFFIGICVVVLLVGLLTNNLLNSMSTLSTGKARLKADNVSVGTDYPGLVVNQYVQEGDKVEKGQKLFDIRSQQLSDAVGSGQISVASLPFAFDKTTQIISIKATDSGIVQKIFYPVGSYAPIGGLVANLNTVGSLYVEGQYSLAPPDYARLKEGGVMEVTFPDNSKVQAKVYNISLVSNGSSVDTFVKARLLTTKLNDFRFSVGTPVEASIKLTNKTIFQALIEKGNKLFKPTTH